MFQSMHSGMSKGMDILSINHMYTLWTILPHSISIDGGVNNAKEERGENTILELIYINVYVLSENLDQIIWLLCYIPTE